jgi:hypothetical protein
MRLAGHMELMGRRGTYLGYWWEPEGKRPLGRPRCRWVNNIKIYFRGTGWDDMNWINVVQDRDQ